ncbi:2737_t:CDS:2 [Acaulospora morrowiae]|uniref:2737_t:CDS:1 n=1 Tax=Acaulospora morrowiae TaxID=94023 RepID=A0A9N8YKA1_9GLOM|nr:2737_t:CDS:2 [Acaulospora morrowiae]
MRRSIFQLPEDITGQQGLTNSVSSESTLMAPVLGQTQFLNTSGLNDNMIVSKQKEVVTVVQNVKSAINQSRSTCNELLQVLPHGLRFDQGPRDQILSTLDSLEEYLEKDDIGEATDNQDSNEHGTTSSPDCQYPCQNSNDNLEPTQIFTENHDTPAEKNAISKMTHEDSFGNSFTEMMDSRQSAKDIGNIQNKKKKGDKTIHLNKDSGGAAKKHVQHSGRRYNTRSADGTRRPKIMFDGFVTELPEKRKLIVEFEQRKCEKWDKSNKTVSGKVDGFHFKQNYGDETPQTSGEVNMLATIEETEQPVKLPTIPKGSFGYFFEDFYKEYKVKKPDHPLNQVMKYAGLEWRGMSEDEKKKYRDRQNAARIRYRNEMKVFNTKYLKTNDNDLKKRFRRNKDKLPKKSLKTKGKLPTSLIKVAERLVETLNKVNGNTSKMFTARPGDQLVTNSQPSYETPGSSTFNKNASENRMQCGKPGPSALSQTNDNAMTESGSCSVEMKAETSLPTVSVIDSIFKHTDGGNESTQSSFFMYPGRKMISQIKNAKRYDSSEQNFENPGVVHKRKRTIH